MALLISLGNLGGGLVGSNIFLDRMKPHYYVGYGVCFAIMLIAACTGLFLRIVYSRLNRQRTGFNEAEIRARYCGGARWIINGLGLFRRFEEGLAASLYLVDGP
jgi:hypothetical protein